MGKSKISVIIPLYYGKRYIQNIIDMFQRNLERCKYIVCLEMIFINDSPDENINETVWGIKEYLEVKLISNEKNLGIHYSRVCGLEHATGEYIIFFDQDDLITDRYLLSQFESIIKGFDVIVSNGIAQHASYNKLLYRFYLMQWTVKYEFFYTKFNNRIISPGQCLIRKDIIPDIWIKNIMRINGADDYFLWLLLLARKYKFGINRQVVFTHVFTKVNVSNDKEKMEQSVTEMLGLLGNEISAKNRNRIQSRYIMIYRNIITRSIIRIGEKINLCEKI